MDLNSGWRETTASRQLPVSKDLSENPPWSGWDVLYIVMVMFGSLLICLLGLTMVVRRVAYPGVAFMQVMSFPLVAFAGQMCSYLVTLGFMFTKIGRASCRERV